MDAILRVVPYGEDVAGDALHIEQTIQVLERLEVQLEAQSLRWTDVGLLLVANSKTVPDRQVQHDSDQAFLAGLNTFCAEREWWPSLIGSSVKSSFFSSGSVANSEINEGLLFTAFSSAVLDRLPVGFEVTAHANDRRLAGRRALERAVDLYRRRILDYRGVDRSVADVTATSIGLVFTSGSGHIEAEDVDFKECYAVGQELKTAAREIKAQLFGGCATNKTPKQRQALYYSEEVRGRVHYQCTYSHAGMVTFLPYQSAIEHIEHPYRRANAAKLTVEFHPREQYGEDRYFYVSRINDKPPIEFLEQFWEYTMDELKAMAKNHTAIPDLPQAHLVTIASGAHQLDEDIWPNVPIWLDEEEDDQGKVDILLRLVRAEIDGSNYYLMELDQNDLARNAEELAAAVRRTSDSTSVVAFLCESRKYVLDYYKTNAEAETMVSAAPPQGALAGIYLNGEYSTGYDRSIGYHNYSQIAAILASRSVSELPHDLWETRTASTAELFVCHATSDKPTTEAVVSGVSRRIPGVTHWRDDEQLGVGDRLTKDIQAAIGAENQYFMVFLSPTSIASDWVRKELKWALKKEQELLAAGTLERPMILPIVLDPKGTAVMATLRELWGEKLATILEDRVQLRVQKFTPKELAEVASEVADQVRKSQSKAQTRKPPEHMAALQPKKPKGKKKK